MTQFAMAKKDLQKSRIMKYFIEAAHKLLIDEGIEKITARKVADLAGYNSATLYNYFSNLDHLICYASMTYLKSYYAELDDFVAGTDVPREIFLKTWELFSKHSFENPKIFKLIFFSPHKNELKQMIETYFDIFPENFGEHRVDLIPMLREGDLKKRNMAIMSKKLGSEIPEDQLETINEIMINLYRATLDAVISGEFENVDDAVSYNMRLIDFTLDLSCASKKSRRTKKKL
ncbi:TetR/AcrR family transcriptional regulator [Acidaminobacter hydrogenoformans]|uniref:Transcriptional regulator, TetR family n=1 Tax=Acidaminobacter hydrogenoformans DSM 2784 TaxID=1120920 RepID=A0A1G5S141_9FIRM|nr:TetR/AcrR family transcriptional regulator [Acidaminobacter hydrogenoformans]SCZ80033.1 transcriptional regulator, TetR family [Acidaminobacter hydrogenoformans DSM 2784]